jgi:hypothetical protein
VPPRRLPDGDDPMSPTLEEAIDKLKANDIEAGQQILIGLLNDDPGNDLAWKHLIESYRDLDFQIRLANEYFNLTGGSQKATQTLLRFTRIKNERYARFETEDQVWLDKLKWLKKIKWFGKIEWKKPLLIKVILGLAAFALLTNLIWLGTSIGASVRASRLQADFDRLSGVISRQLIDYSKLESKNVELETQYNDLSAAHEKLLQAYQVLIDAANPP